MRLRCTSATRKTTPRRRLRSPRPSIQQLKTLGVLEHLEVYPTGGHSAFHVGDPNAPGRNWPDKYLPWLKNNQLTP